MTLRWRPKGEPHGDVLLIHDALSLSGTWWRVGPELAAAGWRVHAPDLSGHGSMSPLDRPLDPAVLVRGVVDRMRGKVDVLAGQGFGAMVALALAELYPDAARTVILEEPLGSIHGPGGLFLDALGSRAVLARTDPDKVAIDFREVNPDWEDADIRYAVNGIAAADVPGVVEGLRTRVHWGLPHLLSGVRVPVFVLAANAAAARNDPSNLGPAMTPGDRKVIGKRLPGDNLIELPGRRYLHRDSPSHWLAAFVKFVVDTIPDAAPEDALELFGDPDDPVDPLMRLTVMDRRGAMRTGGGAKTAKTAKTAAAKGAKGAKAAKAAKGAKAAKTTKAAKVAKAAKAPSRTPPRMPGRR